MTRWAIITTTINVPTNLRAWREALDSDGLIFVAGDLKTPPEEVKRLCVEIGAIYLPPSRQDIRYPELSAAIGWNKIQRRNIALLEALDAGVDYILTLDDDNLLVDERHFPRLEALLSEPFNDGVVSSDTGWFNVGVLCRPKITVRGYPLSQRHARERGPFGMNQELRVGVAQSLVLGDPDIDAIERICNAPDVYSVETSHAVALARGTWCPFNSQATTYHRELAPLMACWPFVGRYDDIWASYLAQKVMHDHGWHVAYGHPLVRQVRNTETGSYQRTHLNDLKAELTGLEHTERFCDLLRSVPAGRTVIVSFRNCIDALVDSDWFRNTIPNAQSILTFLRIWFREVTR